MSKFNEWWEIGIRTRKDAVAAPSILKELAECAFQAGMLEAYKIANDMRPVSDLTDYDNGFRDGIEMVSDEIRKAANELEK